MSGHLWTVYGRDVSYRTWYGVVMLLGLRKSFPTETKRKPPIVRQAALCGVMCVWLFKFEIDFLDISFVVMDVAGFCN